MGRILLVDLFGEVTIIKWRKQHIFPNFLNLWLPPQMRAIANVVFVSGQNGGQNLLREFRFWVFMKTAGQYKTSLSITFFLFLPVNNITS